MEGVYNILKVYIKDMWDKVSNILIMLLILIKVYIKDILLTSGVILINKGMYDVLNKYNELEYYNIFLGITLIVMLLIIIKSDKGGGAVDEVK